MQFWFSPISYYPGWIGEIDGSPTTIYRANVTQRAVVVPAGEHRVSFRFRPASVVVGFWVSGAFSPGILCMFPHSSALAEEGFRAFVRKGGRLTSKLSYYFELGRKLHPVRAAPDIGIVRVCR